MHEEIYIRQGTEGIMSALGAISLCLKKEGAELTDAAQVAVFKHIYQSTLLNSLHAPHQTLIVTGSQSDIVITNDMAWRKTAPGVIEYADTDSGTSASACLTHFSGLKTTLLLTSVRNWTGAIHLTIDIDPLDLISRRFKMHSHDTITLEEALMNREGEV